MEGLKEDCSELEKRCGQGKMWRGCDGKNAGEEKRFHDGIYGKTK